MAYHTTRRRRLSSITRVPCRKVVAARHQKDALAAGGVPGLQETFLWWWVLDRRSQSTHAGLQRPYTEARLCPEVEPRELSADHLQLVLRASFVEPVDQRD